MMKPILFRVEVPKCKQIKATTNMLTLSKYEGWGMTQRLNIFVLHVQICSTFPITGFIHSIYLATYKRE